MGAYHLRRKDRAIEDSRELHALLRQGRFAALALCRDGEPYVVTLNHGLDEQRNCLYFHAAPEGQKLDFIRAHPRACATVVEDHGYAPGECSHRYRSVVLRGPLSIVTDEREKRHAMDVLIRHHEPDPDPVRLRFLADPQWTGGVAVLRLDIEEMTGKASL